MATQRGKAIRNRDHALRDGLFEGAEDRLWDRNRVDAGQVRVMVIPCRRRSDPHT